MDRQHAPAIAGYPIQQSIRDRPFSLAIHKNKKSDCSIALGPDSISIYLDTVDPMLASKPDRGIQARPPCHELAHTAVMGCRGKQDQQLFRRGACPKAKICWDLQASAPQRLTNVPAALFCRGVKPLMASISLPRAPLSHLRLA
ncbi:hypothetical protein Rhe02_92760 [Rhizocola hellebori]|uniref:Uncharacterized protein n=1 Tax=Rhizocola hellebori TaxID=1392758 RepID=A0A8J3QK40_9ACTN|nr:hypothetical protein Rhe02_92760 [Rhizocola hellebori]